MALVIEDGSIVAGATSYATLAELRAYALARGVTLSADDTALDVMAIKAMDYIEAQRSSFKGVRTSETQVLEWPRSGVYINGYLIDDNSIPQALLDSQSQLVMEIADGVSLFPTTNTSSFITVEKVDVLETHYSERIGTSNQPIMSNVNRVMEVLFRDSYGNPLQLIRV